MFKKIKDVKIRTKKIKLENKDKNSFKNNDVICTERQFRPSNKQKSHKEQPTLLCIF